MQDLERFRDHVRGYDQEELFIYTKKLVGEERAIAAKLFVLFSEIESRRLHLALGYSSMFEYLVKEHRFSESEAYRRVSALRLGREVPASLTMIENGSLTLTNACQLQTYFQAERK